MPTPEPRHKLRTLTTRPHFALIIVLIAQAALSLSLANFAFQDEALYIHTGRWMIDSWSSRYEFTLYPESYFSGAPSLYPVMAGWLDKIGGLDLVRAASVIFMGAATMFVHKTSALVFEGPDRARIQVFAAISFASCSSVLFVGHFATFDAPSFCALTAGAWASTKAFRSETSKRWFLLAATALVLAIFLKYASLVAVPFIVLLAMVSSDSSWRTRVIRAFAIGGIMLALVLVSVLTWAGPLWDGFISTTADRNPIAPVSTATLLAKLTDWVWVPAVVATLGFAVLLRTKVLTACVLLAGAVVCVGLQVLSGEDVSLQKHVVLSMIFAAPLCGVALARTTRMPLGKPIAAVTIAAMLIQGVSASRALFDNWPDARQLAAAVDPLVQKDAGFHILGDNPEPLMYALYDETQPGQWASTYAGSFTYEGMADLPAYQAALSDGYFKIVVLDGYTDIGNQLSSQLAPAGYVKAAEVTENRTYRKWTVYQYGGAR